MAIDHYRTLATQYALLAEPAANPLLAEGYRKLAEGYRVLVEARDRSHRDDANGSAEPSGCQPACAIPIALAPHTPSWPAMTGMTGMTGCVAPV